MDSDIKPYDRFCLRFHFLCLKRMHMEFSGTFFVKILTGFAVSAPFYDQVLFYLYLFCWNNVNINHI